MARISPIRILIADDHALMRAGIRALLKDLENIEVVGEAGDGHEALRLVKETQPNIVLMDIGLPELNGIEAAARIAKEFPSVRVLILSMHAHEEYVLQALQKGVAGYVIKDATVAELEVAVRAVARGDTYLSPAISGAVVADYVRRIGPLASPLERLTPRQREVWQLIAEGHTMHEIAAKLHISVKTAETHRAQLMERLDIHDVAGLVRHAIRTGISPLDR